MAEINDGVPATTRALAQKACLMSLNFSHQRTEFGLKPIVRATLLISGINGGVIFQAE